MNKKNIWENVANRGRVIENDIDSLERKRTGSYYTDLSLTNVIMRELVEQIYKDMGLRPYRFLEPCVGSGNFVFSYLKAVSEIGISRQEAKKYIDNIYVSDININAIYGYCKSLREVVNELWNIELDNNYFKNHIGNGLLIDVTASILKYIPLNEIFSDKVIENGFDIIATNPPYKNLKAEKSQYMTSDEFDKDKSKYETVSKIVKSNFNYSTSGTLNLYKLFVEEIIDRYLCENGYANLLIPASIMADKTCSKLRTHMLVDNNILSVKFIKEGSGYIDAHQSLCAVMLKKEKQTKKIKVTKDFVANQDDTVEVAIENIMNNNTGNAIMAVSDKEYEILKKLHSFPTVNDLKYIINLRGELGLTIDKKYITRNITDYMLLRGKKIGYYNVKMKLDAEYVNAEFMNKTNKSKYIYKERIACQQVANMNKERRVTFAYIPEKKVLADSCNFISVEKNEDGVDLYTLLGLFNSKIINWFFKLTSSNNHVNNYEIDSFPIPIGTTELKDIGILAKKYLTEEEKDDKILTKIDVLVCQAFGLNKTLKVK